MVHLASTGEVIECLLGLVYMGLEHNVVLFFVAGVLLCLVCHLLHQDSCHKVDNRCRHARSVVTVCGGTATSISCGINADVMSAACPEPRYTRSCRHAADTSDTALWGTACEDDHVSTRFYTTTCRNVSHTTTCQGVSDTATVRRVGHGVSPCQPDTL